MHISGSFKCEGALSGYKFFNGKYYSMFFYSMVRNDFYLRFTKIIKKYCEGISLQGGN